MIPVPQTRLYDPEGPPGNCFPACIASILECELGEVPWPTEDDGESWVGYWPRVADFLLGRGLHLVHIPCSEGLGYWSTSDEIERKEHAGGFSIGSGPGPRGVRHSVVYQGRSMVHDPHPSGDGLLDLDCVEFLVPFDPVVSR